MLTLCHSFENMEEHHRDAASKLVKVYIKSLPFRTLDSMNQTTVTIE